MAYLLLDAHPAISTGYTLRLIPAHSSKNGNLNAALLPKGAKANSPKTTPRPKRGLAQNIKEIVMTRVPLFFTKSLIASAPGCKIPANLGLLGPRRLWE